MFNTRVSAARSAVGVMGAASAVLASTTIAGGADDGKVYNGAACQFAMSDVYQARRDPPKFQNESGAAQRVVCPIVRDIVGDSGDIDVAYIIASASIDEDTCVLVYRTYDGGSAYTFPHTRSVEVATGRNRTEWIGWDTPASASYAIECLLPAGAVIFSYYTEETG